MTTLDESKSNKRHKNGAVNDLHLRSTVTTALTHWPEPDRNKRPRKINEARSAWYVLNHILAVW